MLCSACSPATSHGDAEHHSQDRWRLPALGSQCKDNYRWFPNHSSKNRAALWDVVGISRLLTFLTEQSIQ